MDDNLLKVFIAVTTFAVLIQAGIMIALYFAVRKTASKIEALVATVTEKALPTVENVHQLVVQMRPKIEVLATNVSETSTLVRNQIERIDATVTDVVDRSRLQVIRADELLNRTMDKVEQTSEVVQKTVTFPFRQVNGIMSAITTGVEVYLGQKKRHPKNGSGVAQDEMFI